MRLHTDTLTLTDFLAAGNHASAVSGGTVTVHYESRHASRSHAAAYEVKLTGDGTLTRKRNMANTGISATYAQHGHFLAFLYEIDPTAKLGPYKSREHFHSTTGNDFLIKETAQ
jgi:hypothetical protein